MKIKHTKESLKALIKLHGENYSAIADALGCTRQNIQIACRKHGIKSAVAKARRKKVVG